MYTMQAWVQALSAYAYISTLNTLFEMLDSVFKHFGI